MNLREFHPKNPDFDLPASEIALLILPAHNSDLISAVRIDPFAKKVPFFRTKTTPDESLLTIKELLNRVLFPRFERELFGRPFPFWYSEERELLINVGKVLDVTPKEPTENPIVEIAFENLDKDLEIKPRCALFFSGLSEKERFLHELQEAKQKYLLKASQFFMEIPE